MFNRKMRENDFWQLFNFPKVFNRPRKKIPTIVLDNSDKYKTGELVQFLKNGKEPIQKENQENTNNQE